LRKNLSLAHYSLRLSSVFVFEMCFAYVVWNHFKVRGNTEPLGLSECYQMGMQLAEIFRSENIRLDSIEREVFEERINFLNQENVINYDKEAQTIRLTEGGPSAQVLEMFSKMC